MNRSDQDFELWKRWKDRGEKPDDMEPLLDQFEPMIGQQLGRYAGKVNIPDTAIRADLENRFVTAVRTYDPNRGTQLGTHVGWHLKGVHRFVTKNQNLGRIPENQISRIGELTAATHILQDELGKVPDNAAVAAKMKWSPAQVKKLRRALRKDLLTTGFEAPVGSITPSRWDAVQHLIPSELDEREQYIFRHTTGAGGAKVMQAQEIAKRLGVSNAAVSRARAAVAKKIEQYSPLQAQLPSGLTPEIGYEDSD